MNKKAGQEASAAVAEYKQILKAVLDNRPSGTRQRLAEALEKNRSFISQITNPAYLVPIPAQHLQTIFQVCHFSQKERRAFEDAYRRAHPRRMTLVKNQPPLRTVTLTVPDFGDPKKNRELDEVLNQLAKKIAQLGQHPQD
jgi:hypothetical protein